MRDKIKRKLKEKRVFIPLIIFFVTLVASGIWWSIASQSIQNPERIVEESDKIIAEEVGRNFKQEISVDKFKKLIGDRKVEKVYHQYSEKEYQGVVKYYIKLKGESGYYLSKATPQTGYLVITSLGFAVVPINDYLNQGSAMFYGDEIEFKVLTTEPKIPLDKTQFIVMGVFLVVFIFAIIFFSVRMMRGGGMTKAKGQEAKKPVYFADVGGVDEALEESREVVEMIKAGGAGK